MRYDFICRTDPGCVRSHNEDAVQADAELGLALLADGMGGYQAGEVASHLAVAVIHAALASDGPPTDPAVAAARLRQAVAEANRAVFDAGNAHAECHGMGTTLVAAWFQDTRLSLGHIGDSRGYRWRDGYLVPLTRDHSLLQAQLDAGLITAEQAARSPERHLITRALGVGPDVQLELSEHPVLPGDGFLLCSDGLTDMLDDLALSDRFTQAWPAPDTAPPTGLAALAEGLVQAAKDRGGRDNISVLLVRAAHPDSYPHAPPRPQP